MSDDMSMGLPSSAGEHGVLRSMQEVAMSSQEASKMLRTYNIAWWGNNYYDVNELGHISVCPDPDVPEARVDLADAVVQHAQARRQVAQVALQRADDATGHVGQARTVGVDDAKTGVAQAGVNAQNAHDKSLVE